MRRAAIIIACAVPLCGFTVEDGTRIYDSSLDFMIDTPNLIGKKVRVPGTVYQPSFSQSYLRVDGGRILLRPPWADRSDFKTLIPACEEFPPPDRCQVEVEGRIVDTTPNGGDPIMTGVDFIFPAPFK